MVRAPWSRRQPSRFRLRVRSLLLAAKVPLVKIGLYPRDRYHRDAGELASDVMTALCRFLVDLGETPTTGRPTPKRVVAPGPVRGGLPTWLVPRGQRARRCPYCGQVEETGDEGRRRVS